MKRLAILAMLWLGAAACAMAQQWELGGMGGVGLLNRVSASTSIGSATAGFQTGAVAGVYGGQIMNAHWSGEARYAFMQSNLRLTSGGKEATFSGNAHVIHYDILWRTNRKGSRAQAFVAVGGGVKLFRGTGEQAAYQLLNQVAYMTQTEQWKPMADVGAGIRYTVSNRFLVRVEFRDYITGVPREVLTPAKGAKFDSVLHDIVPMVGLSYTF